MKNDKTFKSEGKSQKDILETETIDKFWWVIGYEEILIRQKGKSQEWMKRVKFLKCKKE